jgi:hypothetical protein
MTEEPHLNGVEIRKFLPSYESFGLVIGYLTAVEPFSQFRAGTLAKAVRHQLGQGNHVCAYREDRLIGYCGWLHITVEMGERWLQHQGELTPVPEKDADAAALTVVRVDEPSLMLPIIRETRRLNKGRRVFFRRDYDDGGRKRQSVMNL